MTPVICSFKSKAHDNKRRPTWADDRVDPLANERSGAREPEPGVRSSSVGGSSEQSSERSGEHHVELSGRGSGARDTEAAVRRLFCQTSTFKQLRIRLRVGRNPQYRALTVLTA
jgi:hypothetical protein